MLVGNPTVDLLCRLGDRASDPSRLPVALYGERAALAALPGLVQHVRQERERPWLGLDLPHQQLDEARFQQQPNLTSRALDGGPQVAGAHGVQQVQPGLEEAGEGRVSGHIAETVAAQSDDQRGALGMRGQRVEEPRLCRPVVAQGDRLLTLVDDEHRWRARRRHRGQRVHRPGTGGDHHDPAAVPLQRGRHPGPHQRRFAAARRSHHRQHADLSQPGQAGVDLSLPTEEAVGVADVVGHQTQVGTGGPGIGQGGGRNEGRVLAQDRLLQGDQVRPGIDTQLGRQDRAGLVQGAQSLTLPADPVLRQREQGPAALAQRSLGRPGLRLGQHLPVAAPA